MATEPTEPILVGENNEEQAPSPRRRGPRVDPIEMVGPTCMFWAMIAGFVVILGIVIIWGISNLDKIVQ